ncbi:MAG: MFS transporter [Candidatus Korobacteraceae bacterium]|jgi:sugar phosphate permease
MADTTTPGVAAAPSPPVTKVAQLRWWVIAVPLLIIIIIGQVDKVSISMVIANKQFLQDLSLQGRPAVTGLLMSGFLFSYSVCQFFWGYFVKRWGPRACAITGLSMWGVSLLLSGVAHTIGAVVTARIVLGVGEGFMFPVANAFVANWFPVKERGRANSIWLNGTPLSQVLSGAMVVAVISAGGWWTLFYFLAALSLLIPLPLAIFLMRDRPRQLKLVSHAEATLIEEGSWAKTKEIPKAKDKGSYLNNYRFWVVTLAWGLHGMYFYGWTTWMPTYFQTARHFSFRAAGYLYSLSFLFALLAIVTVGYFSDRVMRRAPFLAGACLIAGILMFVGGDFIGEAYWALAVLIAAVCFAQTGLVMIQSLLQSIVPEGSIGAATGVAGGVGNLMAMVSPTVAGFLLQRSGFGMVIGFLASCLIGVAILSIVLTKKGY